MHAPSLDTTYRIRKVYARLRGRLHLDDGICANDSVENDPIAFLSPAPGR